MYRIPLKDGSTLTIDRDDDMDNPVADGELFSLIFLGAYSHLGTDHEFEADMADSWGELETVVRKEMPQGTHIQKVYGYSHGALTVSLDPFSCRFDSGVLGFITITPEQCEDVDTDKEVIVKAAIESLNHWLDGERYWFSLEDSDGNVSDSCGGFLGNSMKDNGLIDSLPSNAKRDLQRIHEEGSLEMFLVN